MAECDVDIVVCGGVVLAVALGSISENRVGVRPGELIVEEIAELAAVFLDTTVDGGARRHREDAVAVVGGVTVTEIGCEVDALEADVLLVLSLAIEADGILDGTKVRVLFRVSGSILDVVEVEVVFASGGDRRALFDAAALEAFVAVAAGVFLTTERLDELLVEACDELFEDGRLDVLLGEFLTERGERYGFVVVDAEFEPHVDCGVHRAPLGVVTRGDPASTESVPTLL